ncbi:efflux pump component MtrF [gamma proteobacterium HTCC5015]|nr:efflux pump component MtrF [gamma proteobacterium HTCC5015]
MLANAVQNALLRIERLGNSLPHPTLLFVALCAFVVLLSALLAALNIQAEHPISGDSVAVKSLLSAWGLREMLTHSVSNFTGFTPVGTVVVAMLGIGFAESSGLLKTLLSVLVRSAKGALITFFVVVAGVLSSLAADAGYVVLVPLAGVVFYAAGRPAVVGMAAAFAGVSGGFSANFLLGPVDVILAGLTTEALALDSNLAREVGVAGNYYFMVASVFIVGAIGTWVTERVVLPLYYRSYASEAAENGDGELSSQTSQNTALSVTEKRGLLGAAFASVVFMLLVAWLVVPEGAPLRHPETGEFLRSPFMSGIVAVSAAFFAVAGSAYGFLTGAFKSGSDWVGSMEDAMRGLASYLV